MCSIAHQPSLNDLATAGVARAFARSTTSLGEPESMKSPDRIASVIAFDGRLLRAASQMFLRHGGVGRLHGASTTKGKAWTRPIQVGCAEGLLRGLCVGAIRALRPSRLPHSSS